MHRRNSEKSQRAYGGRPRSLSSLSTVDWFGLACLILMVACSIILFIRLMSTGMMTGALIAILVAVLLVFNGAHLLVQLRRPQLPKLICGIVAILLSGVMIYMVSVAGAMQSALMAISGKLLEQETTYVVVLKDDAAADIGDTVDYRFGSLSHADEENTAALLEAVKDGFGTLNNTSYDTVTQLATALLNKEVDAILINQGYLTLLESTEEYATFADQTRILYEFTSTKEVAPIQPNPSITREPFVVYCSGIDARNTDVTVTSLSDVNIMAVVNPKTHEILLINTPRDYYVELVSEPYTGQMDKLTHAGGLGIEESMKVLSNLYDVEATYYARVNFTGLVDIVDALGGIDVYSDYDFTAYGMRDHLGGDDYAYHYTEGLNHLDGWAALAFARERSSFPDGDNQRGKNQMAVIEGIVNKAISPQILSSYADVLKAVEGCFVTNMHYEDISALVKMQLRDMSGWNITTYSVTGYNDAQPCATVGDGVSYYVMSPNEESVETAKAMIQQVINGSSSSNNTSNDADNSTSDNNTQE